MDYIENNSESQNDKISLSKRILDSQLPIKNSFVENDNMENTQATEQQVAVVENSNNEEVIEQAQENVET